MAAVSSAWGFTDGAVSSSSTGGSSITVSSGWAYSYATLTDPEAPGSSATDSPWGYINASLSSPEISPGPVGSSPWGTVSVQLRNPHKPIGVKLGAGVIRYSRILTKIGSTYR